VSDAFHSGLVGGPPSSRKRRIKKVVLAKQTIRELSSRELTAMPVVGGLPRERETAASNQDVCCA